MPLQGSLDNRYEVKRSLGRGGMAEVYLARDRVLERDVALKILSRCYAEDGEFVRRFRREAQSAASLAHPNVVSIHDLGEVEGEDGEPPTYYIAMEYVEGISLRELLEQEVRLPYETAVAIARQITEGLAAAHEQGIVHRDIKPHNILLSETVHGEYPGDGRGGVKVADFGIARAASSTTTNTEGILGTAHYLSPEQAMGADATLQSDLYSLGVVLYEMLTGRRPYDAESPFGVAMRHVTADLRPPKEILPDLPEELNSIVVRLLGKDPEERHADAEELLEDLESLPARPEPREALSGGGSRQRGSGLLVPICALMLLVASLWGVQQGFGLSSLTGVNPGDVRSGVERILGGDPPRDNGASQGGDALPQPGPAAEAPGESTDREHSSDKEQKEDGEAGGETREDPSGSDGAAEGGAAGGESGQDVPSEDGSSDSPGNGSTDDGSTDDGSPEGGSPEGGSTEGGSTEGGAENGTPESGTPDGDSPPSAPEPSRGGAGEASPGVSPSGQSGAGSGGSGGEEQLVYVPDLAGQSVETSRSALQSTGFEVAGVVEQPAQAAEGTVLYTDPAAGSALEPGTGVTLVVSSGAQPPASGGGVEEPAPPGDEDGGSTGGSDEEDMVSVPDITGRQSEQAVMILESAGLRAEVSGAFGGEESGTVVATDPPAGSTVEEGTTVTLTVIDGPRPAAAPVDEKPTNDQYQYEDRASESGGR